MVRSTALLSISMRPSVRNRHSPSQYLAMYLSASPKGALADTRARWAISHASNTAINGADCSCRTSSRASAFSPRILLGACPSQALRADPQQCRPHRRGRPQADRGPLPDRSAGAWHVCPRTHGYLSDVLTAIAAGHKQTDINELLPWNYAKAV